MEKTKVTITRQVQVDGNNFFVLTWDEGGQKKYKHMAFKENVPYDDIYNEEKNKEMALKIAAFIEENGSESKKELIYETDKQKL